MEDFLLQVKKPARYIGKEWNISRKDFDKAKVRFALCFPDLYEVGMSNLGIRIIYGLLNSIEEVCCERFFAPDIDMENVLRSNVLEIVSLESKKVLKEFDIAGFSLASELDYTNVLNILELGNIPLKAAMRNHSHPLVIAGGPSVLNPEPMHEFFDIFVIGESEGALPELIREYRKYKEEYKSGRVTKPELLLRLCRIEGIYVPGLYEVKVDSLGAVCEFKPKTEGVPAKINKLFISDLDSSFFPLEWLVPYIQIIHDRITLEIMRGCPNRCRFCQARVGYYPFRLRKKENILALASALYKCTGYDEISLSGLSVSDYPRIEELVKDLMDLFKDQTVSVSLPSLKAKALLGGISSVIATVKKTGLTFAPEAGSERMRNVLAKDFSESDCFSALKQAFLSGYQHVKLYFMIGLPGEEKEDLDAIVDFSVRVSELRREAGKPPAQVNISVNTLIPKPHTPFQWFAMQDSAVIKDKQDYLRGKIKNKRLKISFHNVEMSLLEGAVSRGDRSLSQVIYLAFKNGARFDAWGAHFKPEIWLNAFREAGVDFLFHLRERPREELLPWDFIDTGIDKEVLICEFNKAIET